MAMTRMLMAYLLSVFCMIARPDPIILWIAVLLELPKVSVDLASGDAQLLGQVLGRDLAGGQRPEHEGQTLCLTERFWASSSTPGCR